MKRKVLAVWTTMILGIGLLTGCGTGGEQTVAVQAVPQVTEKVESKVPQAAQTTDIYVFIAASLKNTMELIKENYESEHPKVHIIYNSDSSGTLQTQIEEGAECDIFFSAATKQMTALEKEGLVTEGSVVPLLENKIVLIKPAGVETTVTGFDSITSAANIALAGEDVPVGQYARQLFYNIGILNQVMAIEINECANVTAVLTAVAEGSNEVGVVYATDAASMPKQVEIIAEATADQVESAVYPVGLINNPEAEEAQIKAAEEFINYITTDTDALNMLTAAGFRLYAE